MDNKVLEIYKTILRLRIQVISDDQLKCAIDNLHTIPDATQKN